MDTSVLLDRKSSNMFLLLDSICNLDIFFYFILDDLALERF